MRLRASLLNPLRWAEVVRLGQEGWELVSVQPLMRGVTEIGNQNAQGWAWGVALPVSYLLFFKRSEFLVVGGFRDTYGRLGVYFIYISKGDG